jgi:hypothetical protein
MFCWYHLDLLLLKQPLMKSTSTPKNLNDSKLRGCFYRLSNSKSPSLDVSMQAHAENTLFHSKWRFSESVMVKSVIPSFGHGKCVNFILRFYFHCLILSRIAIDKFGRGSVAFLSLVLVIGQFSVHSSTNTAFDYCQRLGSLDPLCILVLD